MARRAHITCIHIRIPSTKPLWTMTVRCSQSRGWDRAVGRAKRSPRQGIDRRRRILAPAHIFSRGHAINQGASRSSSRTAPPQAASLGPRLDPPHDRLMPDDAVLRVEAVVVLARQVEHLARHAAPLQRRERGDALYTNTCHAREAGAGRHQNHVVHAEVADSPPTRRGGRPPHVIS